MTYGQELDALIATLPDENKTIIEGSKGPVVVFCIEGPLAEAHRRAERRAQDMFQAKKMREFLEKEGSGFPVPAALYQTL